MTADAPPRVAVITGASSGLGLVAAKALASQGFRIIGQGRDLGRTAQALEAIRAAAAPGVRVDMVRADLSLVAEARRAADEIAGLTDRIDVLLNNAGGTASALAITAEGNEATFAGNHLGHFVLTDRLLPLLQRASASAPAGETRIINVSSSAHEHTTGLNWDDLQSINDFVPIRAYCNAKLANVLFTKALAARLGDTGIVVHAMHPGAVATNFINYADAGTQAYLRAQGMISPEEGADTLIWLATDAEPGRSSGQYYHQRAVARPSPQAEDAPAAERLWQESAKLVASVIGRPEPRQI